MQHCMNWQAVSFDWNRARAFLATAEEDSLSAVARAPGLEPVLPELDPIPVPIWLATHRELHTSRRIRLVFDHLAEAFASLRQG